MPESKMVPISSIIVADRAREEYDGKGDSSKLSGLVDSIRETGLINPLSVAHMGDEKGTEITKRDGEKVRIINYRLLAGERRLMAMKEVGYENVPVRVWPKSITPLQMETIELHENIHRLGLGWLERVKLEDKIHNTQVGIHGEKTSIGGWSQKDTAALIDISEGGLSQDRALARAAEVVPEIESAESKNEAMKILLKMQEKIYQEELAKRLEDKRSSTPIDIARKEISERYIVGDFFDGVKKISANSIDFVELDPPFGVRLKEQKKDTAVGALDEYTEISEAKYPKFISSVFRECYRVMTKDSFIVVWYGFEKWGSRIKDWMEEAGFFVTGFPACWTKPNAQNNQPTLQMSNCHEFFYYGRKGTPIIVKQGRLNDFSYRQSSDKIHPTEKPIELYEDILSVFCGEGYRILSPFLGSGNVILSASNLGMVAFGFDSSSHNRDTFVMRVFEGEPGSYKSYR